MTDQSHKCTVATEPWKAVSDFCNLKLDTLFAVVFFRLSTVSLSQTGCTDNSVWVQGSAGQDGAKLLCSGNPISIPTWLTEVAFVIVEMSFVWWSQVTQGIIPQRLKEDPKWRHKWAWKQKMCIFICRLHVVVLSVFVHWSTFFLGGEGEGSRSGELQMQKLKSHLVRAQSLNVLPSQPGVGQHIALHAMLTAKDFFLAYFYPSSPFTCIIFYQNLPLFFSYFGCG